MLNSSCSVSRSPFFQAINEHFLLGMMKNISLAPWLTIYSFVRPTTSRTTLIIPPDSGSTQVLHCRWWNPGDHVEIEVPEPAGSLVMTLEFCPSSLIALLTNHAQGVGNNDEISLHSFQCACTHTHLWHSIGRVCNNFTYLMHVWSSGCNAIDFHGSQRWC